MKRSITFVGIAAASMFACGPFLYTNIAGRGLFFFLAFFFAACVLLQALKNRGRIVLWRNTSLNWFYVCVAYQMLAFLWSPVGLGDIYTYLKIVLFFVMLCACRYTKMDINLMQIAQTLIAFIAVTIMLVTKTYTSGQGLAGDRLSFNFFGVAQDPNYMCFMIVMPILWLSSMLVDGVKRSRWVKALCIALVIYFAYGILATGSRGGLIGVIVAIVSYLAFYKKMSLKKLFKGAVLAVVIYYVFLWLLSFLPSNIGVRFSMETILEDGGSGRIDIWQRYMQAIGTDLWTCVLGAGTMSGIGDLGAAAHNYFIEIWYENGLVGLLLMIVFYAKIIRDTYKAQQWLAFSGILGALALSMTLSCGVMREFWFCITLAYILLQKNLNEEKNDCRIG